MADGNSSASETIDKLRDALRILPYYAEEISKACESAMTLLDMGSEPKHDDWSVALSGSEIDQNGFRTVFYNRETAQTACSTGWPAILRDLKDALRLWWTAWEDAKKSLESLPKNLVDDSSTPNLSRWSTKLARELDRISETIRFTRDARSGPRRGDVDIPSLLSTLRHGALPASLQAVDFTAFERDLFAIRGLEDGIPRAAGKTTHQRMRDFLEEDESLINLTKRQWADKLDCSKTGVQKTQCWEDIQALRELSRNSKGQSRDRHHK